MVRSDLFLCDLESNFCSVATHPFLNPESCSSPDPITDSMDYTDDLCMEEFTLEQTRRVRCTLFHYRPNLYTMVETNTIFVGGFESGDTTDWSSSTP